MKNLHDLFCMIDNYTAYLNSSGFEFTYDGFPVFKRDMFLDETPEMMIPVNHRDDKRIKNKKKTLIVFYCGDVFIYRRMEKLFSELDVYKEYMGVVGADITVTGDMDIEWQRTIILLNLLFMAVLANNGIRIVLNTRAGGPSTMQVLSRMPKEIMVASGFLGCSSKYVEADFGYISKLMQLMPSKVLIYGSCSKKTCKKLDTVGINYAIFTDFRRLCKEETK